MISLKEMENQGFESERHPSSDSTQAQEIHPAAPDTLEAPHKTEEGAHQPDCGCVESQTRCGCTPPAPAPSNKVEVRTWVNPKGWMLLGMSVALVAWLAIFFTLSGLGII